MSPKHSLQEWGDRWCRWLTRPKLTFFFVVFLLSQVTLFFALETTTGMLDRRGQVRGRDFLQFYIGGRIVASGEAHRLYDQELFHEIQLSLSEINDKCPRYFSTYPPMAALLFSSLGRLSYEQAICRWWLIQLACFISAAVVLFRSLEPSPEWRRTAWLGLAAFYPVLSTFWNGQLASLFLLCFVVGFELHHRCRPFEAGLVLSLLAMKPQFALGVGVWLLLRRDFWTLVGCCCGGLLQAAAVSFVMGPKILLAYSQATRSYPELFRMHFISADHQHAIAGIFTNHFGGTFAEMGMAIHFLLALYAGFLLLRVINAHRCGADGIAASRLELSAAVIFILLLTPHLLTYDLSYLLVPIAYGLAARRKLEAAIAVPLSSVLYLFSTLAQLYLPLGFSFVPLAMVGALHVLATGCDRQKATLLPSQSPNS